MSVLKKFIILVTLSLVALCVCLDSQLQKSAVLQKTIDYIRHLESMVRRLTEENDQLKEALANSE